MDNYAFVEDNIRTIQEKVRQAAARSGRNAEGITLLAVTKFHPAEAVRQAFACGIRRFGENRVQEAMGKYGPELRSELKGATLDMIGSLQSNKIKKALALFDGIQSVGSLELLKSIEAKSAARSAPLDIFFELHTGEESKSGFPDESALFAAVEELLEFAERRDGGPGSPCALKFRGLMTMAPFTEDRETVRASFRKLAKTRDEIAKRFPVAEALQLSMGMSGDYEIAVEEGATMLRIGTAIFGERR